MATQKLLEWASEFSKRGARERRELLMKAAARVRSGDPPLDAEEREMIGFWLEQLASRRVAADVFHFGGGKARGRPKGDRKKLVPPHPLLATDDSTIAYNVAWLSARGLSHSAACAQVAKDFGSSRSVITRIWRERKDEAMARLARRDQIISGK